MSWRKNPVNPSEGNCQAVDGGSFGCFWVQPPGDGEVDCEKARLYTTTTVTQISINSRSLQLFLLIAR